MNTILNKSSGSNGIGFLGLLVIVFIVLKLTNYIDWSWWFVLMPLWLPLVLSIIVGIIILVLLIWANSK